MSLNTKIPLILVVVIGVYALLDFSLQRYVVLPQFLEIERESAARDLERCKDALAREVYHLDQFCLDWAAWDDTYEFVNSRAPEFIEKNLPELTFLNYGLNMLYIVNRQGEVLWGRVCKVDGTRVKELPAFLPNQVALNHPLLNHRGTTSATSGLTMTQQGPMMLASRPVYPSLPGTRESNGTLIMGRFVSDDFLTTLRRQTHVDVDMWPLDGRLLPAGAPAPGALDRQQTAYVVPQGADMLHAYSTYDDVYGRPVILFRVGLPREILRRGLNATKMDALGVLLVGLALLLLGIWSMRRTVTGPLSRLTDHVTGISTSGTLPLYRAVQRRDEIGVLGEEFNSMILRLREDLQQRQRAEDAVRDSEQRLRAILAAAPDGIMTVDGEGVIESLNDAAARLLGYTEAELLGRPFTVLSAPGEAGRAERVLQDILHDGRDHGFAAGREVTMVRKQGEAVPVHLKVSVMHLGDRRLCTGIFRDLREFKALHERMLRAAHLAALGEMGASVAHEIRNPLAGISGAVQVLVKELPEEHRHRYVLKQVLALVGRVENTVRQLLDYAKEWRPRPQRAKVLPLLRGLHAAWAASGKDGHVAVEFRGADDVEIAVDAGLFRQVFENLTENAVHSMNGAGTLVWEVLTAGEQVEVRLTDQGSGLQPEARERLFQPFFTTKTTGTGLGLAICRRIVEAHGGTIALLDNPGGGTTVLLTFERLKQSDTTEGPLMAQGERA